MSSMLYVKMQLASKAERFRLAIEHSGMHLPFIAHCANAGCEHEMVITKEYIIRIKNKTEITFQVNDIEVQLSYSTDDWQLHAFDPTVRLRVV